MELRTSFNELWTSSGIFGPVCIPLTKAWLAVQKRVWEHDDTKC